VFFHIFLLFFRSFLLDFNNILVLFVKLHHKKALQPSFFDYRAFLLNFYENTPRGLRIVRPLLPYCGL